MEKTRELTVVSRPAIPTTIQRAVKQEAGYRCAIPTCRDKGPFDFEHIDEWSKVKKHEFHNIILLCVGCHARVTRGEIHKDAIRNYKMNLAVTNGRYSLFEIRLLETFYEKTTTNKDSERFVLSLDEDTDKLVKWVSTAASEFISRSDLLHIKGLIDDGLVIGSNSQGQASINIDGLEISPITVSLTDAGKVFIENYFSGKKLE